MPALPPGTADPDAWIAHFASFICEAVEAAISGITLLDQPVFATSFSTPISIASPPSTARAIARRDLLVRGSETLLSNCAYGNRKEIYAIESTSSIADSREIGSSNFRCTGLLILQQQAAMPCDFDNRSVQLSSLSQKDSPIMPKAPNVIAEEKHRRFELHR